MAQFIPMWLNLHLIRRFYLLLFPFACLPQFSFFCPFISPLFSSSSPFIVIHFCPTIFDPFTKQLCSTATKKISSSLLEFAAICPLLFLYSYPVYLACSISSIFPPKLYQWFATSTLFITAIYTVAYTASRPANVNAPYSHFVWPIVYKNWNVKFVKLIDIFVHRDV